MATTPPRTRAIEVATAALGVSESAALRLEREAFITLAKTDAARNLMGIFFLQERAKKTKSPRRFSGHRRTLGKPAPVKKVPPSSARASWARASRNGPPRAACVYLLKDINPGALSKGIQSISKIFADATKRRVFTAADAQAAFDRVIPVAADVPLRDVDLVVEAAVETARSQEENLRQSLEAQVPAGTVLATNTSALSIDAIADGLKDPANVVSASISSIPVHRMQLVEIVRGPRTGASTTLNTALGYVKGIGKLPVIVKDSPGFLVNRILLPYMSEALRLFFEEGYEANRIDSLMLDFGMPMGPLRLMDEVGLDVGNHVARDLTTRLPGSMPAGRGHGQKPSAP